MLADEGLAQYDQDDYTLKEAIASEGKDREEEKTKLEEEMMEFHKKIMKLSGDEEDWRIQVHLEEAQDHSRKLKQLEESSRCSLLSSDCLVEKKAVTTDWGKTWIHVINVRGRSWVTSTEVSGLISEWRGWDLLEKRLKSKHLTVDRLIILKGDETWKRLMEAEVEGLKDKHGEIKEDVSLYRLDMLPDLFNLFTEKCKVTATSLAQLKSLG